MSEFDLEQFREDYNEGREENVVSHLDKLAEIYYKEAREDSDTIKNWRNYLKAHALWNSCLAQDGKTSKWRPILHKLEKEYNKGSFNLSYDEYCVLIEELKVDLAQIRETMKGRLQPVEGMIENLNTDDLFGEENIELLKRMNEEVFANSDFCTQEMQRYSRVIMQKSEVIAGPPPCLYCVVALGSMARGEATPYSDLEYIFLIESDEHKNYFHRLAVTGYFLINNLGESPLKCVHIKEFHDFFGDTKKEVRWFFDNTPNGFKTDGITPRAGHVPTGKGGPGDEIWIKTPEKAVEAYKTILIEKSARRQEQLEQIKSHLVSGNINADRIDTNGRQHSVQESGLVKMGDMADMLSSTVNIHSYGNGESLYDRFKLLRETATSSVPSSGRMASQYVTLLKDMHKYDFKPNYITSFKQRNHEVKFDIFRYPTLLLHDLRMAEHLASSSSHEVLDELRGLRHITTEGHLIISILLATALHVRLAAYLTFGMQKEQLSFHLSQNIQGDPDRYYFPRQLFLVMSVVMVFIKAKFGTHDILEAMHSLNVSSLNESIKEENSHAQALHYCGDYERCVEVTAKNFGIEDIEDWKSVCGKLKRHSMPDVSDNPLQHIEVLCDALSWSGKSSLCLSYHKCMYDILQVALGEDTDHPSVYELLNNMGVDYSNLGDRRNAIKCYQNALDMIDRLPSHPDANLHAAYIMNSIGLCYTSLGEYQKANYLYQKSLMIHQSTPTNQSNIASVQSDIGSNYSAMGNYQKAKEYHQNSLRMQWATHGRSAVHPSTIHSQTSLANYFMESGDYNKADECYHHALQMLQKLHGETVDHPDIADIFTNMGTNYGAKCDYERAWECFQESLAIRERIHGKQESHPSIGITLSKLSNICTRKGQLDEALDYGQKSLIMLRRFFSDTDDHPFLALALDSIASCHQVAGSYHEAIKYYKQSLKMNREILGKTANHPHIAADMSNLASNYRFIGDFDQANRYSQEALTMLRTIYGDNVNMPDISDVLVIHGKNQYDMGNHQEAESYYQQALEMQKCIYGETGNHPSIMTTLSHLGLIQTKAGNLATADAYYQKSLQMGAIIFGKNADQPEIASVLHALGSNFEAKKDFQSAHEHYQKSLEMEKRLYGETANHSNIADTLINMANIYATSGDNDTAVKYYRKSLAMKRTINGEEADHHDVATILQYLGSVYKVINHLKEAADCCQQSLEMRKRIYGETAVRPGMAKTLEVLGRIYASTKKHDKAIEHFRLNLKMDKALHGDAGGSIDRADVLYNMGSSYLTLNNWVQAKKAYHSSHQTLLQVLGDAEDHFIMAASLNGLGTVYHKIGDYSGAADFYQQSLKMKKRLLGETSGDQSIVNTLIMMADNYNSMKNYSEATEHYKQALRLLYSMHGENNNHPLIVYTMNRMAKNHKEMGHSEEDMSK